MLCLAHEVEGSADFALGEGWWLRRGRLGRWLLGRWWPGRGWPGGWQLGVGDGDLGSVVAVLLARIVGMDDEKPSFTMLVRDGLAVIRVEKEAMTRVDLDRVTIPARGKRQGLDMRVSGVGERKRRRNYGFAYKCLTVMRSSVK